MRQPAEVVDELERHPELPPGAGERFYGYGVMGLPFESGHVLGLRRFSASPVGPGYRSVWHRDPRGRWTFYQDVDRELACSGMAGALPDRAWRSDRVLAVMSRVAGAALGAGRVRLAGVAPNGQRFTANPLKIWVASSSRATIGGHDLGKMGPAPEQAQLRDFALPQRGLFVVGRSFFGDPRRA